MEKIKRSAIFVTDFMKCCNFKAQWTVVYLQNLVMFQIRSQMHSGLTVHSVFEHEILTNMEGILL